MSSDQQQGLIRRLIVRWKRWRLLRAYSRVFSIRTGKDVGFSPLMAAYEQAERDDILEMEDGEVRWSWP